MEPNNPQPQPYTVSELLKATLTVPFRPWRGFGAAAARPASGWLALVFNTAAYAAAFFAMNLAHAAIAFPGALDGYPLKRVALVAAASMALLVLGSFAAAAALHAVARAAGGRAPFQRSYQAVSMLGLLLPLQSAALWVAMAAALPLLLAAVLAAAAIEAFHGAQPARARAFCAALALAALLSFWAAAWGVKRTLAPYLAMQKSFERIAQLPRPQIPGAQPPDAPQAAPTSGLDPIASGAADSLNEAGASMLGAIAPLLSDPKLGQGLTEEQRQQLRQLTRLLAQLQGEVQSKKPLTPQQRQQLDSKLRQLLGQFMLSAGRSGPAAAAPQRDQRP